MKNTLLLIATLFAFAFASAQEFSRRDSLHGGLRPERTSFDVLRYDLNITVNPDKRFISGYNDITFKVVSNTQKIQLDLFENMKIESIMLKNNKLKYTRDNDAVFIVFPNELKAGSEHTLRFNYSGKPKVARNAPWDGGFVFTEDYNGKPWIGVAVQGTGASLWYPVKDHQSDEPDNGASIKVAVPNGLMNVSNGRFKGSEDLKNGYTRWDWEVINPINNYDITVNIADYVHIHDNYKGLDLDYYVLGYNKEKAEEQFKQVKPMMECFQTRFGEYPFKEDGYKLVETPYLGMEHQSAVAYGNNYKMGYRGGDLSYTGVGLTFDYIIIHETGHEWFGNSITSKDIADMWIHESFTTYSETVYLECMLGYDKAMQYVYGQRMGVRNDKPVVGIFGVNNEGSGDMYYKGALMLNTIRHIVNNDDKWWAILLKYAETYKKQVIEGQDVINFFSKESGMNLEPVFNQYLRYRSIPKLELKLKDHQLQYRWETDEENFAMPVDIDIYGKNIRLNGTNNWQTLTVEADKIKDIQPKTKEFYIKVDKM
ncbi:M1 family metallopeptidase [Flavobacterium beibuense]|uniref:M1 family metallopeptidase n=1 Tax=Flavobacterium beibuense TaxID=657326 RepID=UPI003A8F92DB